MATQVHSFISGFSFKHALLFGLLCGCALLTKGPVGIGVPLLSAIGTWWLGRKEIQRGSHAALKLAGAALLLGSAMFIGWGISRQQCDGE